MVVLVEFAKVNLQCYKAKSLNVSFSSYTPYHLVLQEQHYSPNLRCLFARIDVPFQTFESAPNICPKNIFIPRKRKTTKQRIAQCGSESKKRIKKPVGQKWDEIEFTKKTFRTHVRFFRHFKRTNCGFYLSQPKFSPVLKLLSRHSVIGVHFSGIGGERVGVIHLNICYVTIPNFGEFQGEIVLFLKSEIFPCRLFGVSQARKRVFCKKSVHVLFQKLKSFQGTEFHIPEIYVSSWLCKLHRTI